MDESEVCDSMGTGILGFKGVRREILRGSPRRVADGSCEVGRKAGSSSSDEGPLAFFLVDGKRRCRSLDWNW